MISPPADVWSADLTRLGEPLLAHDRRHGVVPAGERARLARGRDQACTLERVAAHVLLRLALAEHLRRGASTPAARAALAAPLSIGSAGKPELPGSGLSFSLAHVDGWALVAVSAGARIGVDLERERTLRLSARRAIAIAAAGAALTAGGEDAGADPPGCEVLGAWVRLEAAAKCEGGGIAALFRALGLAGAGFDDLAAIRVRARDLGRTLAVHDIRFNDGAPGTQLFAAVAGPRGMPPPRVRAVGTDLGPLLD